MLHNPQVLIFTTTLTFLITKRTHTVLWDQKIQIMNNDDAKRREESELAAAIDANTKVMLL
jgi:hypothetical protein